MRRHRVIQLDDPSEPTRSEPANESSTEPWMRQQRINSVRQSGYEKRWRESDVLCIERQVTSEIPGRYGIEYRQEYSLRRVPACVDFEDIREATTFEVDEDCGARPWDYDEGFAHREIDIDVCHKSLRGSTMPRGFYRSDQGGRGFLILDVPVQIAVLRTDYYRARGSSKQVAYEQAVVQCRRALDQLVEWYSNGWWWYGAACRFEGYEDSLWGFLDMDDEQYARKEVADTVARMMQSDGYTILNWPPAEEKRVGSTGYTKAEYHKHLQQNLNEQNWSYP